MIRGLDFTHIREENICEKRSPCTYEKLQELPSLWASTYVKLSLYFKDYMFKIQALMVLAFIIKVAGKRITVNTSFKYYLLDLIFVQ